MYVEDGLWMPTDYFDKSTEWLQGTRKELFAMRCVFLILLIIAILIDNSYAYVGPGLGLGAIGAIVGVIVTVFLAIVAVIWYPLKRMLRKLKPAKADKSDRSD